MKQKGQAERRAANGARRRRARPRSSSPTRRPPATRRAAVRWWLLAGLLSVLLDWKPARAQEYVGEQACSVCHATTANQTWASAQHTWKQVDPHARAYHMLFRADSVAIAYRYRLSFTDKDPAGDSGIQFADGAYTVLDSTRHQAFVNQHCANCHATSALIGTVPQPAVSCESCHGAASDWIDQHDQGRTTAAGRPAAWLSASSGFRDLRQLTVRAATCVKCHVGSVASHGEPARRVSHDLIAAGHPAMRFELASYLASLPPHWHEKKDRGLVGPTPTAGRFWRQAWKLGKVEAVNASIRLLEDQLARSSREDTPGGASRLSGRELPFPDLAQFSCFACHQSLDAEPARSSSANGWPLWLSWHAGRLPALANPAAFRTLQATVSRIRRPSDLTSIAGAAGSVEDAIAGPVDSWDQAAQAYLAYFACYLDHQDAIDAGLVKDTAAASRIAKQAEQLLQEAIDHHLLFRARDGSQSLASPQSYDRSNMARLIRQLSESADRMKEPARESTSPPQEP